MACPRDSGGKSRQPSKQDAVAVPSGPLTPIWRFTICPSVPEYWRATQGEDGKSFLIPMSSITHALGAVVAGAKFAAASSPAPPPTSRKQQTAGTADDHPEAPDHRLDRHTPAIEHQPPQIQHALGPLVLPRQRREPFGHEGLQFHTYRRDLFIPNDPKLTALHYRSVRVRRSGRKHGMAANRASRAEHVPGCRPGPRPF